MAFRILSKCRIFQYITNTTFHTNLRSNGIHISTVHRDLMEFFDDKKNWAVEQVKVGRSWSKDELRIKSNQDLHKLWYVLLKERNMLLTMEHECKAQFELFPNPERIDKVEESMNNLETVVRERNDAYYKLEVGESAERPGQLVTNLLGLNFFYRKFEHLIPKFLNKQWKDKHTFNIVNGNIEKFQRLYREKLHNANRKSRNRDRNHVMHLMKRYPNMDMDAVKQQYPTVDIEKIKSYHKVRGHYVP
ncbi:39S ribosomal protein L47, mitochondrial isoform X1 [Myzus persicae]|uniref:39S ribosomal protein L47, mitochondrial isoform X1 n=2 Tax=Myzus persicae TaxID=13164 RepID=UPI000B931A14|nr:39S ribosomal protein L47, mitochondrial isoform X1 [Myzus persicae]